MFSILPCALLHMYGREVCGSRGEISGRVCVPHLQPRSAGKTESLSWRRWRRTARRRWRSSCSPRGTEEARRRGQTAGAPGSSPPPWSVQAQVRVLIRDRSEGPEDPQVVLVHSAGPPCGDLSVRERRHICSNTFFPAVIEQR